MLDSTGHAYPSVDFLPLRTMGVREDGTSDSKPPKGINEFREPLSFDNTHLLQPHLDPYSFLELSSSAKVRHRALHKHLLQRWSSSGALLVMP